MRPLSKIKNSTRVSWAIGQPWWPALALVLLSIAMRLELWLGLPKGHGWLSAGPGELYTSALTEHFWEYILFQHTKPPLTFFIHALLMRMCGQSCFVDNVTLLPVFLLDSLAVGLVYSISVMLGIRRSIAWLFGLFWSVELMAFEVWRSGGHQDHLTIPLVAFFAWAFCKRVRFSKLRYDVLTSVAGGLLLAQSTIALLVVPCVVLASALAEPRRTGRLRRCLVATLLPVLVAAVLVIKNGRTVGIFNTSSIGGQNMMQFVSGSLGSSDQGFAPLYRFAAQINLPAWWLWCFQRADQMHPGRAGPVYGKCFWDAEGFKFDPLYQELIREQEWRLAEIVRSDARTWHQRPWLFSGPVPESTSRFAAEYGKVSSNVWTAFVITRPDDFVRKAVSVHLWLFNIKGPMFFWRAWDDLRTWPAISWEKLLKLVVLVLAPIFSASAVLSYVLFGVALMRSRGAQMTEKAGHYSQSGRVPWTVMSLLCFAYILTAVLFSISTCCENDRFFVQVTPYLVPISSYLIDRVSSRLGSAQATVCD